MPQKFSFKDRVANVGGHADMTAKATEELRRRGVQGLPYRESVVGKNMDDWYEAQSVVRDRMSNQANQARRK